MWQDYQYSIQYLNQNYLNHWAIKPSQFRFKHWILNFPIAQYLLLYPIKFIQYIQGLIAEYFQLLSDSRSINTYNLPKARNTLQPLNGLKFPFLLNYNSITQTFIQLNIHWIINIILVSQRYYWILVDSNSEYYLLNYELMRQTFILCIEL